MNGSAAGKIRTLLSEVFDGADVQIIGVFAVEVDEEPMRQLDGEQHANKIFTLFGRYVDDEAARAEA